MNPVLNNNLIQESIREKYNKDRAFYYGLKWGDVERKPTLFDKARRVVKRIKHKAVLVWYSLFDERRLESEI